MPNNTPIPDAELAEVKRLVAAATSGKGEAMEDILRDVRAMISGNKQLRTAFRTMQAERDQLRAEVDRLRDVGIAIDHCEDVLKHAAYQFSSHAGEQDNVSLCENALAAIAKWKGTHES